MKRRATRDEATRRVWAYLTQRPHSSIKETAEATKLCTATVVAARNRLRKMEYIDWVDDHVRTTRVLFPLFVAQVQRAE
jgi:DNA-binding MarR family transcriptional regulator